MEQVELPRAIGVQLERKLSNRQLQLLDVKSAATVLCAASGNNTDTACKLAVQLASMFEFFIRASFLGQGPLMTLLRKSKIPDIKGGLIRATKKNLMVWTIRNTRQEVKLEFLSQGQGW